MDQWKLPFDIISIHILPVALDLSWDGYNLSPVLAFATIAHPFYQIMFDHSNLDTVRHTWFPLFNGSRRELLRTCFENRDRMNIAMSIINGLHSSSLTYDAFPRLVVREMGVMFALQMRFRLYRGEVVSDGPMQVITPLLVFDGICKGAGAGRPPIVSGVGSFIDSKGRYGEGTLVYSTTTARNWMGMRTIVAITQLKQGFMRIPGGTTLEGEFTTELVSGKRTYSNGHISGTWTLSADTEAEIFGYTSLQDGQLTVYSDDGNIFIDIPSVSLTGRHESPYPLDQLLQGKNGPIIEAIDIDGVIKRVFCDNNHNVIVMSDVE
eukprot:TRINITY_DN3202_c1_g1_i1.p1 TRINITY_DN3202_c1_g1~~TRINITY_DN3202_c1_g1_i1.p1  ORF type:complete len:322 (+),score=40.15 TRINITY_DN3202_c1_g1_i1:410-1375(+)